MTIRVRRDAQVRAGDLIAARRPPTPGGRPAGQNAAGRAGNGGKGAMAAAAA